MVGKPRGDRRRFLLADRRVRLELIEDFRKCSFIRVAVGKSLKIIGNHFLPNNRNRRFFRLWGRRQSCFHRTDDVIYVRRAMFT